MRTDPFKAVALLGFASGTGPTFENKTENSLRQRALVQAIRLNIQPVPFQIEHALSVSLMFHLDRTIERFSMAKRNRWTLRSWRRCVVELPRGSLSTGVIATWRAVPFDRSPRHFQNRCRGLCLWNCRPSARRFREISLYDGTSSRFQWSTDFGLLADVQSLSFDLFCA